MKRPVPLDAQRAALLGRVRQRDTTAERIVGAALRRLGLSYRKNVRSLPGSPDFANKTRRWAVFVNGCFWHQHRGCKRATIPKNNRDFWVAKFAANRRRDAAAIRALRRMGFRVAVVWECEAGEVERRLANLTGGER
ncbi:MAG TPA: DNA mismatch endonuclease Vsr [Caulobacteraceae bacterium]|nr:DNA mismatch endonuclease Vsr [Caulobacteraceae bacterium]